MDVSHFDARPVWRGDVNYYRERLRSDFTYESLLEKTCHDYVSALADRPLLGMRQHAYYLATIFADRPLEKVVHDMSRTVSHWLEEGLVVFPDEYSVLFESGNAAPEFAL